MDTPSSVVGPGLGAFVAFFGLAVILWLLMRNMNGRMRRMAYREQQRVAELEASRTAQGAPVKRKRKRAAQDLMLSEDQAPTEGGSAGQDGPDASTPTP